MIILPRYTKGTPNANGKQIYILIWNDLAFPAQPGCAIFRNSIERSHIRMTSTPPLPIGRTFLRNRLTSSAVWDKTLPGLF